MRPCTYMNVYTEAKVFTFWCVIYSDIFYSSPFCKTNKTKPQRADYPNQLNWSNDSLRVVSLRIEGLRPMSCRIPGCDSQFCWSWKSNLSVYSVTTPTKFLSDLKKKKLFCYFNMLEIDIFDDQNVALSVQSIPCGSKGAGHPYWGMKTDTHTYFSPDFRET